MSDSTYMDDIVIVKDGWLFVGGVKLGKIVNNMIQIKDKNRHRNMVRGTPFVTVRPSQLAEAISEKVANC